jgi:hypothetical protein
VTVQPEGGRAMTFAPRVIACIPEREFRWRGKVAFGGVFDGEHAFLLTQSGVTACSLTHEERFSGLLVPIVMRGATRSGTEAGFVAMNRALKARAEGVHG